MSVIVTGTVSIDTVYTPSGHAEAVLGGSAVYFAAAASFFSPVRIVAAVGDDFPEEHRRKLEGFPQVDSSGVVVREGSKTFRWGGKYHENVDHRDTLFTELGVLEEEPPEVPDSFRDARYVFLANTHPGVQLHMRSQFPDAALVVADTMDLWINETRSELDELLKHVHGLVLNFDEAEQLTGKRNTVSAARTILESGPSFVIVKKGEHGCFFVHRDGMAAIPAYPAETVVDPTGAGDSFAGGLMGHIARTCDATPGVDPAGASTIRSALAHGTIIASFCIESFSLDRLGDLSTGELDRRYDEFVEMTRVG